MLITCPLCKGEMQSFLVKNVFFHECLTCELIIKDQRHYINIDDEKKRYETHQNDYDNQGYLDFLNRFIHYAVTPTLSQGSILDYGSGPTPVLAYLLRNNGYEVDCYDPIFEPIATNKTYDLVVSTEVFEHFFDIIKSIKHIDTLLKTNGYLALMTLFHPRDKKLFTTWFYQRDHTHVAFYTPKTFEVIAQLMDWDIIKHDGLRMIVLQKKER